MANLHDVTETGTGPRPPAPAPATEPACATRDWTPAVTDRRPERPRRTHDRTWPASCSNTTRWRRNRRRSASDKRPFTASGKPNHVLAELFQIKLRHDAYPLLQHLSALQRRVAYPCSRHSAAREVSPSHRQQGPAESWIGAQGDNHQMFLDSEERHC